MKNYNDFGLSYTHENETHKNETHHKNENKRAFWWRSQHNSLWSIKIAHMVNFHKSVLTLGMHYVYNINNVYWSVLY